MPSSEGFRPFQAQGVKVPIESVGVRGSGRRPGERRLNLVRPSTPEQPRTLLQEMQQYITIRQNLRENGYFFLMGKEPANINLADATHNDLFAIKFRHTLPDNAHAIGTKGNDARIRKVFNAYAMGMYSSEKQREVLAWEESIHTLNNEYPIASRVTQLTPAETETASW